MHSDTEQAVEITFTLEQIDYRRTAQNQVTYQHPSPAISMIASIILLCVFILAGNVPLSLLLAGLVGYQVYGYRSVTRMNRRIAPVLPEPATLRLTAEGVAYETGLSRQFLGWPAIDRVRHSPLDWWFIGYGMPPMMVPTRAMTFADQAALDTAIRRYQPDVPIRCVMSGPHHTTRTGYQPH